MRRLTEQFLARTDRSWIQRVREAFDPPGMRRASHMNVTRDIGRGRFVAAVGLLAITPLLSMPHRARFALVASGVVVYSVVAMVLLARASGPWVRLGIIVADVSIAGAVGRAFPAVRPAGLVGLALATVLYTAIGGLLAGATLVVLSVGGAIVMGASALNVVFIAILGVAGMMIIGDVTAHERIALREWQRAEAALRQHVSLYETMLNAQSDLGEGIIIAENGRCVWANQAYERITGYTLDELTKLPSLLELATPEEREIVTERMRQRMQLQPVPEHYETAMIRKDGKRIALEVSHKPLVVAGQKRNVTIVRDVTERKRVEEALRISQQRFAEAYARERDVAERLRALDEMKNGFLTAVSHELRTPLTSVLGFAQTLYDHDERLGADMRRSLLERMTANANKLNRLLSDLLDVDRARRGILEPNLQTIDLHEMTSRVVHEWEQAGGRRADVQGSSVVVAADPSKVERIVENLLSNAAKYSPPTGRIWVRYWRESGGVVIAVEDEGSGVPDELKRSVFEPFMRAGKGSEHAPGTGIGLSLVAQFAAIHEGRAWVEDREGGGASFRIFLPDLSVRAAS